MIVKSVEEIDCERMHGRTYKGLVIRTDEGDIYALCEVYYCETAGVVLIEGEFDINKHRYCELEYDIVGEEIIGISKNDDCDSTPDLSLNVASLRLEFADNDPMNLVIYQQYDGDSPDMICILGLVGKEVTNKIGSHHWTPEQCKRLSWHASK